MNRLLVSIQKALNYTLALDPESKRHLRALQGKIVTVELRGIDLVLQLAFVDAAIHLTSGNTLSADTVIQGTPLRLLQMALTPDNRKQFFADDVSIQGNVELGQRVIDLFDQLEIDWEEIASRWVGDIPAYHLGRIARTLKSWGKKTHETLLQDVNEYIHEEADFFPPREALEDFFQDVDILRMDVDRLDARIQNLHEKLSNRATAKRSGT